MTTSIISQLYLFGVFILTGFLIGIIFDTFRVLRKSFKTPDFITYLEDILFWVLVGFLMMYSIFTFNNGELRIFIFLAIIMGFFTYILLFSRTFILINVSTILFIKKIVLYIFKITLYPFKLLRKILIRPISFLTINIRKFFKNIYIKLSHFKINLKISNKKAK